MLRAVERGGNLGNITSHLLSLLDRYGAANCRLPLREPSPVARHLIQIRSVWVAIPLPEHVRKKDTLVTPHRLDIYDQITGDADEHA